MRSLYCIAATSLLAAGCEQSAKDVMDENRPQLEARVRTIEQFAKNVESGEASTAKLTFPDGEKLRFVSGTPDGNTMRMQVDWALGGEPKFEFDSGEGLDFKQAKRALIGEHEWLNTNTAQYTIEKLLKPRYLLLVKVDKVALPRVNVAEKTFEPGWVEVRVYGFDLKESKELGMASCQVESSDKVSVRGKYKTDEHLKSDLVGNATLELRKALQGYLN